MKIHKGTLITRTAVTRNFKCNYAEIETEVSQKNKTVTVTFKYHL